MRVVIGFMMEELPANSYIGRAMVVVVFILVAKHRYGSTSTDSSALQLK